MKTSTNINMKDSENQLTELKKQLSEEKNNNQKLKDVIDQLKKENKNLKKNYESEITKLKDRIKILETELSDKNKEIQNYISQIKNINGNQNQIIPFQGEEEKFSILFVTKENQDILNFEMKCKNTDLFVKLEERLYDDFPKYKNYETYFMINTRKILRFKTIKENEINDKDIIYLLVYDK